MSHLKKNLEFEPNLRRRIIATLIDYGVFLTSTFLYTYVFGETAIDGGMQVEGLKVLPILIVWFLYFVVIEGATGGTIGHHSMNLEVMTINRKPISYKHALKRHLLDPIDFSFLGISAIIAIKNSDKHQRIGDMWAKTIVVEMNDFE